MPALVRLACAAPSCTPIGRLDDVLEGGHVREEVEALEHHADVRALLAAIRGRVSS